MNQNISICSLATAPEYSAQLRSLFLSQWKTIDPFAGNHPEITVPSPIIALDSNKNLVGGLAFTTYRNPGVHQVGIWISAVYILPEQRGKGLASQLIQHAENASLNIHINELHVQSQYPNLYLQLGWQAVENTGGDHILKKSLSVS